MTQVYRTLRVAPSDEGVLGVVIDAPPMNLIGPELVRDLVGLLGVLESGQETRVVVLESADPDYFVPHVDLTKVAEYTAEAAKAGGPDDASQESRRLRQRAMLPAAPITGESATCAGTNPSPENASRIGDKFAHAIKRLSRCVMIAGRGYRARSA